MQTIKRYEQSKQMGLCQTLIHHLNTILVGGYDVIGWYFDGLQESPKTTERIMTFKKTLNIGEKYGMLTILEEVEPIKSPVKGMEDRGWYRNNRMVKCLCECGKEIIRKYTTLPKMVKMGRISSCGCYNPNKSKQLEYDIRVDNMSIKEKKDYTVKLINEGYNNVEINMITKRSLSNISLLRKSIGKGDWIIDGNIEIGLRSDRLVILSKSDKSTSKNIYITCKCDCGNIIDIRYYHFKSGTTKSCGCFQKELSREMMLTKILPNHIKHSDSNRKSKHFYLFNTWMSIKQRCFNPNNKRYYTYGGRGITIYEQWVNDYTLFKEWMLTNLGERPTTDSNKRGDNYSLDRINNDGNYEPGNLKWSTFEEQSNNRSYMGNSTHKNVPYRLIYEKFYNTKLRDGYQIHHIDGDRKNNDPRNLIDVTPKEHGWLHRKINHHLKDKSHDEIRDILNTYNTEI